MNKSTGFVIAVAAFLLGGVATRIVWKGEPAEESGSKVPTAAEHHEDAGAATNAAPHEAKEEAHGVTVKADAQQRIGLATAPAVSVTLETEIVALGFVLDPSALVLLDSELSDAESALTVSTAQAERARVLFSEDQNVSRRTLETAETQVRVDRLRVLTATRRLGLDWGNSIASLPAAERRTLVERLLRKELALLRLELPAGATLKETPARARVQALGVVEPLQAEFVSEAPTVDPKTQGRALFYQVVAPATTLRPGAAVSAFLATGEGTRPGWRFPAGAVVRHLGATWIYLQTGAEQFERTLVSLDRLTAEGWITAVALPADARLVITGPQQLLAEELKSQIAGD